MIYQNLSELLSEEDSLTLQHFERIWVGFSGGLDSTVLLHALASDLSLVKKIQAVHINHGLSQNTDDWEARANLFCKQINVPLTVKKIKIGSSSNLEEVARKARYEAFRSLLKEKDALLLAHHRDDQAETVLLQLFRGAGVDGLSAMLRYKTFAGATLVRPLLHYSRKNLEAYARVHQLSFVIDESNADCGFARNFLRNKIIPELETRWPGVQANLARTAKHCLNAQTLLSELAEIDYEENIIQKEGGYRVLCIEKLRHLSFLRLTNILRTWLRSHVERLPSTAVFNRLITEVIFAKEDKCPEITWGKYRIKRYQHKLYLLTDFEDFILPDLLWPSFPDPLELPKGLGVLQALSSAEDSLGDSLEGGLIIPEKSSLVVSFRKGGEEIIFHGQRKSLKKLFQEWQIPPWLRGRIPLLYINGELAAVIGYAVSDAYYGKAGASIAHFNKGCEL